MVAPESARGGHGCGGMPRTVKALCVVSLAALAEVVGALPVDGVVVGGSGAIDRGRQLRFLILYRIHDLAYLVILLGKVRLQFGALARDNAHFFVECC